MTNTTVTKAELIANLLEETQAEIFKIHAMTDGGYVQICGDLFVNETLFLGGLLKAVVYTDAQMQACEDHGVGVPSYTNGNGEKSCLISVKQAKRKDIAYLTASMDVLANL